MSVATAPFFDTHACIKRLVAASMPEPQAEALTEAINDAMAVQEARQQEITARAVEHATGTMDTKAERAALKLGGDIARLDAQIKAESARLEAQIKAEIARLEAQIKAESARLTERMDGQFKLLHWMLGILIAFVVAIALKLFLG